MTTDTETRDARRADVLQRVAAHVRIEPARQALARPPAVPVVIFVPAIIAMASIGVDRNGVLAALGWFAGGYLVWTLTEYWLHRIVFHFEPDAPIGRRLHWIIHGVHHDHPNDPMRLVMPPSVRCRCRCCSTGCSG